MKKRVLSTFMALALCLTLLPVPAWAEEVDTPEGGTIVEEEAPAAEPSAISEQAAENGIAIQDGESGTVENAVAEVTIDGTTTEYTDIDEAFKAAQKATSATTVKLLENVTTETQIVVESGTFTLDLNGQELNRSQSGNTLRVNSGGNVTVTSSEGTGAISNPGGSAIYVAAGATVHIKKGVQLNSIFAEENANLTLDVGVIITETLSTNADNIATFLTDQALQACDKQGNKTENAYVSIYQNYKNNNESTGCVIVIEHKKCAGTPSQSNPCKICGYDGTQTKPTEPVDPNVAEVNGTKYKTLQEAIAAANGAEITLLGVFGENVVVNDENSEASIILGTGGKDQYDHTYPSYWIAESNGIPLTMNAGEITLKGGVLAQYQTGADNNIAIKLTGGTLTVADTVTKIIGGTGGTAQRAAIEATGGVLDLKGNTHLDGGLSISGGAQLAHKLKAGIFTNSGSSTYSVSVEGSNYTTVFDLLAEGYAFAKYDTSKENNAGEIVNGYVNKITEDVIVVAHPEHTMTNGVCACGFTCTAHHFEGGKCTVCGYECPHPNATEAADGTYTCDVCKQQMVVKVEKDDTTTYYAARRNSYNDDETLWWLFNNALESGSTVTLLADGLYASGWAEGKELTLNLNGKNVIENNGFVVESKNGTAGKLIVTGSGSSETPEGSGYPCTFRVWNGELLFDDNFSGTFGTIYVHGGTLTSVNESQSAIHIGTLDIDNSGAKVSFKAGNFGKITGDGVTLGDLLPPKEQGRKSGKAFKHTGEDGAFVPYDTQITSSGVENVTITDCPHDSITSGKDTATGITYGICGYCGMDNIAAVLTKTDGSIQTFTINNGSGEIFDPLSSTGGTLKLYSGLTCNETLGTQGDTTKMVIDLNGHTISLPSGATGQTVALNGGKLTITDSGTGEKGSFTAPLSVYYKAGLIVDGVSVGKIIANDKTAKITLKAGTTFTGYEKPDGTMLAQWIEDGNCISGINITDTTNNSGSGIFAVAKAPATFGTTAKSGTIQYGTDRLPDEMYPAITLDKNSSLNDGVDELNWAWTCIVNGTTYTLFKGTYTEEDGYLLGFESLWGENVISAGNKLDVTFTLSALAGNDNTAWSTVLTGYKLTVTQGQATVTTAPADKNLTYTGSAQNLVAEGTATGGTMKYRLNDNPTWQDSVPTGENASEYTVWYKVVGDDNHEDSAEQSIKVTIAQKEVTNPTIEVDFGSTYNGEEQKPKVTVKDENGTEIPTGEYTATYSDNINAGENTAAVTITDKEGGNYTVSGSTKFSIQKATAPSNRQSGTLKIANNHAATYTYDVSQLLPTLGSGEKYGTVTYACSWNATDSDYVVGTPTIDENGLLTLHVNAPDLKVEKQIGSVTVTVTSTNYDNFTLLVYVNAVNKLVPTGAPTLSKNEITYGDKLSTITLSGAMKDGEATVHGTFAWTQPDAAPAAGTYTAEWKFTPADSSKYMEITGTADVAVNKATPSGAPKYTAITTSGKKLSDAALAANGSWPAGTVKWVDANGNALELDTEVKANTAYKWVFTPTDADNYNEISGSITLYSVSTGGGGGGSTTTSTETTTNPDGSTTKTETKSDGTVVETTTNKDGSTTKTESKTETKSDGSTVETVTETRTEADGSKTTGKTETTTAKDGTKTETKTETSTAKDGTKTETKSETKTDANGVTNGTETSKTTAANGSTGTTTTIIENGVSKTEAKAKVSDKAVSDAKKADEAVKIPAEVTPGEDSKSAPTVKIDLPTNAGETKIEIPVKDVSAGTVAVIVHPDGTEELIKESLPTEGGVQLTVDGSVTVKIVDNAKDFKDTKNHWAADSIDFVSARGLVNGTSESTFSPNAPTTRAQLWTILARQAGADLTGGASWYEKAQEWAKESGISDGSDPNGTITRAQMVTMLWRAAGGPEVSGTSSFTDVPADSYYAKAVAWAVENGITTGVGNGKFDPNGTCTRAQIAAFLHRSYLSE